MSHKTIPFAIFGKAGGRVQHGGVQWVVVPGLLFKGGPGVCGARGFLAWETEVSLVFHKNLFNKINFFSYYFFRAGREFQGRKGNVCFRILPFQG